MFFKVRTLLTWILRQPELNMSHMLSRFHQFCFSPVSCLVLGCYCTVSQVVECFWKLPVSAFFFPNLELFRGKIRDKLGPILITCWANDQLVFQVKIVFTTLEWLTTLFEPTGTLTQLLWALETSSVSQQSTISKLQDLIMSEVGQVVVSMWHILSWGCLKIHVKSSNFEKTKLRTRSYSEHQKF